MAKSDIHYFKKCFEGVSIKELSQRIYDFELAYNSKTLSIEDIISKLNKITLTKDGKHFFLKNDTKTSDSQIFHFYRIRKFSKEDHTGINTCLFKSMISEQDAWWPPSEVIKTHGRLNRPGHPVLYLSSELKNAILETKCLSGDYFFVSVFRSKRSLRLSQIHNIDYMDEFSELDNAKRILIHKFLLSEFKKHVPSGAEHLYKGSIAIYESFFNSPMIDAFVYPSIATSHGSGFNISFDILKAKDRLKLLGVMVCRLTDEKKNSSKNLEIIYDGFVDIHGQFNFIASNSEYSRNKFETFTLIRDTGFL